MNENNLQSLALSVEGSYWRTDGPCTHATHIVEEVVPGYRPPIGQRVTPVERDELSWHL